MSASDNDVILYLADPAWLDGLLECLRESTGTDARTCERRRAIAAAIIESGSIACDGRVQLFFSTTSFDEFMEAASSMGPEGMEARGVFCKMAAGA